MEFIQGDDDMSCTYNAYMDEYGQPLVGLTTRIIRRFPTNMGQACYEVVDRSPDVAALGLTLFRAIGLRGIGCVEFKRDRRDGELKMIEVNARFIGPDRLLVAAGVDLAAVSYDRLTGRRVSPSTTYRTGLRLWFPKNDFLAFRERRRAGTMMFAQWAASLLQRRHLPLLDWRDPAPDVMSAAKWFSRFL